MFTCLAANNNLKEYRNGYYFCTNLNQREKRFHFTSQVTTSVQSCALSVHYSFVSITSCLNNNSVRLGSVREVLSCVAGVTAANGLFLLSTASLFVSSSLPRQYEDSACLNSGILNAYTTGFTKELEKSRIPAITRYLKGIETASMLRLCQIIRGSHDSKARRDTNSSVFVKRFFCGALLSCCKATLPCRNFIQMPMLQPHMNK